MLSDSEFRTEAVLLPHDQNVLIVCNSEEHNFLGQTKQTFNFSLPPSASVDEIRKLLADKLSTAPANVHLQVLVRESNEYGTVTRGSIADVLAASNPETNTLTLVYTTESRYGCDCCTALCAGCCVGMCVGCCMADD